MDTSGSGGKFYILYKSGLFLCHRYIKLTQKLLVNKCAHVYQKVWFTLFHAVSVRVCICVGVCMRRALNLYHRFDHMYNLHYFTTKALHLDGLKTNYLAHY